MCVYICVCMPKNAYDPFWFGWGGNAAGEKNLGRATREGQN